MSSLQRNGTLSRSTGDDTAQQLSGSSSTSVSSLASRFEQLAGSSSKNGTATPSNGAGPPLRPVKPSRLRANSSSSKNGLMLEDPSIEKDDKTRSRGLSNASTASTAAGAMPTDAANAMPRDTLAPPPPAIPFASRPSLSTPGLFSYGGTTPPTSPSRKSSRSPPPVPPPRSSTIAAGAGVGAAASRPSTSSSRAVLGLDLDPPMSYKEVDTAASDQQQDGNLSVASLAARFGSSSTLSRPTTPKAPPSPARVVSPKPPVPPARRETATEASSALQQITSQNHADNPFESPIPIGSPSIDRAGQTNPFDSPAASPEAKKTSILNTLPVQQNRSPPIIRAPRPLTARASIPALVSAPPTPPSPYRTADQTNGGEPVSIGLSASSSSPSKTTGALPPMLPARKKSDSALASPSPGLLPALPARSGPALPARPRSATVTASSVGGIGHAKLAVPATSPARRETVAASTHEQIAQEPYLPPPPPVRNVPAGEQAAPRMYVHSSSADNSALDIDSDESDGQEGEDPLEANRAGRVGDMPDATFANRRPPRITPERTLSAKHAVNAFGVCGRYAVTATVHVRMWDTYTGESVGVVQCPGENKVTAVEYIFTDTALREQRGQVDKIWAGTKDGGLFEIDLSILKVTEIRSNAHSHTIAGIFRHPGNLVSTVDECGKVQIWSSNDSRQAPSLNATPRTNRMGDKHTFCQAFGTQLWSSTGPHRHHVPGQPSAVTRSPSIRIFDVSPGANFALCSRPLFLPENVGAVGTILAGAAVPAQPNLVYLAHESGHISIWEKDSLTCISTVRISTYAITALEGVVDKLWAGNREGVIQVFDMGCLPWKVLKAWKASDEPISGLSVDLGSIAEVRTWRDTSGQTS